MKLNNLLLVLLCGILIAFSSCKDDDPILGCTDSEAENFNADATESDNTCVFARDKFLGAFMGTINCGALITEPTDFTMEISESLNGTNDVQIEFKDTTAPFPIVSATITGNVMTINEDQYNIEYQGFPTEVTIAGDATINDDQTSLEGTLSIDFTDFPITDNCAYTATK